MPDKNAEFRRINEPRVEKIRAMIATIEKSAKSNRIDPLHIRELLRPAWREMQRASTQWSADAPPAEKAPDNPEPGPIEATPPIARELEDLDSLCTQQLVDRMIACGALLASRRK